MTTSDILLILDRIYFLRIDIAMVQKFISYLDEMFNYYKSKL